MVKPLVSRVSNSKSFGVPVNDSIPIPSALPRLQNRLAEVIRRRRRAANMSQEAFADHIEMHRAQYGFVERGKRDLRLSTLERIAKGLEQPLWEIVREAEEAGP